MCTLFFLFFFFFSSSVLIWSEAEDTSHNEVFDSAPERNALRRRRRPSTPVGKGEKRIFSAACVRLNATIDLIELHLRCSLQNILTRPFLTKRNRMNLCSALLHLILYPHFDVWHQRIGSLTYFALYFASTLSEKLHHPIAQHRYFRVEIRIANTTRSASMQLIASIAAFKNSVFAFSERRTCGAVC